MIRLTSESAADPDKLHRVKLSAEEAADSRGRLRDPAFSASSAVPFPSVMPGSRSSAPRLPELRNLCGEPQACEFPKLAMKCESTLTILTVEAPPIALGSSMDSGKTVLKGLIRLTELGGVAITADSQTTHKFGRSGFSHQRKLNLTPCRFEEGNETLMGRYTGPKARINRRLGFQVFESAGAIRASERKEYPPGMAQRRRKPTNYGLALIEKQKIKYYYGLREKHLRTYFDKARHMPGNTGENLLTLCERRLDNVVRRAGFAHTRPQARQGVVHGHFQLNGRTVTKPSVIVRVGDVLTVRNRPNLKKVYAEIAGDAAATQCHWISADSGSLAATVTSLPHFDDVSLPVDVGQVVAFLSR